MAAVSSLADRIDAEFAAADERVEATQDPKGRRSFKVASSGWKNLSRRWSSFREIWRPRLEALAKKFGERVKVQPKSSLAGGVPRSSFNPSWPASICDLRWRPTRTCGT